METIKSIINDVIANADTIGLVIAIAWGLWQSYRQKNWQEFGEMLSKGIETIESRGKKTVELPAGKKPSDVAGTVKNYIKEKVEAEGNRAMRRIVAKVSDTTKSTALGNKVLSGALKVFDFAKKIIF